MNNAEELFTAATITSFSAVGLAFYILLAIAVWRVFSKAGYAGILALIPIVNLIILVKIAGYSGWFVLLYLIPVVNVIIAAFVAVRVGENFGKGPVFSIFLLWLFPIIGYFIVGLGNATYREPVARY
ncbi:hypothetical protein JSO19_09075 [Leucobacter sp. UCMA 4100]|uniref:DUF5684 domain-containing protein n=1 Tax=Leucobacter sp. UCMA 4100 TaxID=2810534 RepID=UPI0022EAB687|nr:DUF5684 domain-containing protein [Leucobacter sp. UCMA 4100]MDA3147532.1 hypothetical protein [Leucobacter sp. UCMA 4100]